MDNNSSLLQSKLFSVGDRILPGLNVLILSSACARDATTAIWDFALEIEKLYELDLNISDLRWLVAKGYLQHGIEITKNGDGHRKFEITKLLTFGKKTCFVLTGAGEFFAENFIKNFQNTIHSNDSPFKKGGEVSPSERVIPFHKSEEDTGFFNLDSKPQWHAARRELRIGDVVIKRFRVPAPNQEWILEVFEEDGWPESIDDPLPPSSNIDPKVRLHDTINRLNGRQINPVLRFRGNGHGNGVCWEVVSDKWISSK